MTPETFAMLATVIKTELDDVQSLTDADPNRIDAAINTLWRIASEFHDAAYMADVKTGKTREPTTWEEHKENRKPYVAFLNACGFTDEK